MLRYWISSLLFTVLLWPEFLLASLLTDVASRALLLPNRVLQDVRLAIGALSSRSRRRSGPPPSLAKRSSNQQPQCRLSTFPANKPEPPSSTSPSSVTPKPSSTPSPSNSTTSGYNLVLSYSGTEFYDQWDFWDLADPTHGVVTYLSLQDAQNAGLVSINSAGHLIMKADTTPQVTTGRASVRITTQASFNGGLLIMDALHMPTGCGTWPAFWTNGPDWPINGEIDIVEGVNTYIDNQATVHTVDGCTLPSNFSTPSTFAQFATAKGNL